MDLTNHTTNQKYGNYIQPYNQNLYKIIDSRLADQYPDWTKRKILDFGCNVGNLLLSSNKSILQENYTGVDVQTEPLSIAQSRFPNATWIASDFYHPAFNPSGTNNFPDIKDKFDIIFCIGVFTHCDIDDIEQHINFFKTLLNDTGFIVFSIWEDYHFKRYCDIFLKHVINIKVPAEAYKDFDHSLYLVDRTYSIADNKLTVKSCDWLETFFTQRYLMSKFKGLSLLEGIHSLHSLYLLKP